MSQPQKYEKTTTFANLKNVTQAFPQIDKELNNVASSINQIRDNLKVIQRDDGDVIITKNIEDALMQMAKDGVDTFGASIKATADNANSTSNNAVVIANNAYQKADNAENIANNAVTTANESAQTVIETVASIAQTQRDVDTAIDNIPLDISGEVSAQTANLPTLINEAVEAAVVEKSGVTEETITTALGYKPASPASVTAETTARQTAVTTLQENITAEATARQTAVTTLQENITAEATARQTLDNSLKTVAKTGAYSDLTGKPTLATVATSGSYNDLLNKPESQEIPTNVSAFVNDAGYLTQHQSLTDYATKTQLSSYLPRSGGTMTGFIHVTNGGINNTATNGSSYIYGGTSGGDGAFIQVNGMSRSYRGGGVVLQASNGTIGKEIVFLPNGSLTLDGKNILREDTLCTTQPTTTSTASASNPAVVVENYYDSTTGDWYRIHSDGFIEQGGIVDVSALLTDVSLHTPFTSTKYSVKAVPVAYNTAANESTAQPYNYQVNSFKLKTSTIVNNGSGYNNAYVRQVNWEAKGY